MNKQNRKRIVSLALLVLLVFGLLMLTGCAAASTKVDENWQVSTKDLSTEVKYGIFDYVKIPFAYLLRWLYDFTGNYGLALIVFGILVKTLLLPASMKSKKGMMKMSRLTPQVKALEAKYGDDKQKYQAEVSKLYKAEGASGCSGCLWSLLPLLILIPLYQIIREPITWLMFHGNLSQAAKVDMQNIFLAHARTLDSSSLKSAFTGAYWQVVAMPHIPDMLPQLQEAVGSSVQAMTTKFLGIEIATVPKLLFWQNTADGWWNAIGQFLLPMISGGINWLAMWIGQKMNSTVIVDKNGEQDTEMAKSSNQTNKMMNFMMPLFSVYIGFVAPAGLSLYWITQGVYGLVQDYFLTKHYKKVYDAEDAIKQERARVEAEAEAERERIRAEKRAQNPDGITANTSKKRLEQKQRAEQAAKEAAYQAKLKEEQEAEEPAAPSAPDARRPNSRGRAYRADRYDSPETKETNEE